jgi:hypothetical protein
MDTDLVYPCLSVSIRGSEVLWHTVTNPYSSRSVGFHLRFGYVGRCHAAEHS